LFITEEFFSHDLLANTLADRNKIPVGRLFSFHKGLEPDFLKAVSPAGIGTVRFLHRFDRTCRVCIYSVIAGGLDRFTSALVLNSLAKKLVRLIHFGLIQCFCGETPHYAETHVVTSCPQPRSPTGRLSKGCGRPKGPRRTEGPPQDGLTDTP
jgi:hypothetical protein